MKRRNFLLTFTAAFTAGGPAARPGYADGGGGTVLASLATCRNWLTLAPRPVTRNVGLVPPETALVCGGPAAQPSSAVYWQPAAGGGLSAFVAVWFNGSVK